jgi:RNA polymerase sigma-70 factor (ECF subfamily)
MERAVEGTPKPRQEALYADATREFGAALDRLAAGYEADAEKRRDLRQEIHLQLWRSLAVFDGRCSLKTWTFRVAHNTAVSYVHAERRKRVVFAGLEEVAGTAQVEPGLPTSTGAGRSSGFRDSF